MGQFLFRLFLDPQSQASLVPVTCNISQYVDLFSLLESVRPLLIKLNMPDFAKKVSKTRSARQANNDGNLLK